jgi:Arylsulfotransferase (ASST)
MDMVTSEPDEQSDDPAPPSPPEDRQAPRISRRSMIGLGVGGVLVAAAGFGAAELAGGGQLHRVARAIRGSATPSETGSAEASGVKVLTPAGNVGAGDLFVTDMAEENPRLLVLASDGTELWTKSGAKSYADFRVQSYQGRSVFTWWESESTGLAAYADGHLIMTELDGTEITRIEKHGTVSPDEHEFLISPDGTALIVSYVKTRVDLSDYGGSTKGWVMDGVFEEIDIATGTVLQHWSSLEHIGLDESYAGVPKDVTEPYDYFHINSVKPTPDGNFLVSARHTWGVYKVARDSGEVMWRLGGRKSDYDVIGPAAFAWQHDAQYEGSQIRMFDNGSDGTVTATSESRILWLELDDDAGTATLVRRLAHPDELSAAAMGNAERLPNGNLVVGWGTTKRISEFAPDGSLVFDAELPHFTYRCFRDVWR